jgi:hypothetical protein
MIRPVIDREGEEVLRIAIRNPRSNTWVNPDWEHAPATGYENPSAGHEAGR